MRGDIIYVKRIPLGQKSVKIRENPNSCWIDKIIFRWIPYKHYGIDLGDSKVIHFQTDSILKIRQASIRICTSDEFKKDGSIEIDTLPFSVFQRDEVVQRAISKIGSDFGGYRVKENNCEHFSMWCATGVKSSKQDLLKNAWNRTLLFPSSAKRKTLSAIAYFTMHS